jgi:hypothetical protein
MLDRLKAALSCALLAALTGVAVQAILLLHAATQASRALPGAVSGELQATRSALVAQVAAARGDLSGQIEAARKDLLARTEREVADLRTGVLGEVAQIRTTADLRVGDSLARVDTALGKVEELRGDIKPVLANAATFEQHADALTGDVKDSLDDLYFDLKGSVASATVAATSVSQMSLDVRAALPKAINTWQGIGTNVDGITANINRLTKPRWYDRLLGYGLNGVVIYRNLNPATNLTIKGAQIISSRP